jgi:hypothetical protein
MMGHCGPWVNESRTLVTLLDSWSNPVDEIPTWPIMVSL